MRLFSAALLIVGSLAACGSDTSNPNFNGTAYVSIDNLTLWTVVSGTVEVQTTSVLEQNTAKVELVRNSDGQVIASTNAAPFALSWDTTQTTDGVDTVWARATDKAGKVVESPMVRLVVLNHGTIATTPDTGNVGELAVPSNYSGVQELIDVREHWINPTGVHTITAVLNFAPAEGQGTWNVSLSVGKGFCPDDGQQYGDEATGSEAPLIVTVPVAAVTPATAEFATGQYFAHLRPNDPYDHLGESAPYRLDVFLLE